MDTMFYASACLFVIGLVFIAVGLIKEYLMKSGNSKSKIQVEGTISSIKEKKVKENGNEIIKYFPTYTFTAGKKKISKASEKGYYKCQVAEGDSVKIFYNETDPEKFYVEDELDMQISKIFIYTGIGLIVFGAVLLGMFLKI